MAHKIGTRIVFSNAEYLENITNGKEYAIVSIDADGDEFFIDDAGDPNWSACTTGGALGVYTIVTEQGDNNEN